METETKAMLRFLPSKSTRNTTANPLRCFSYFTYHTLCSLYLSLSRGNLEERQNQQSRHTKTQERSQRNGKEKEKSKTKCRMFTFRETQETTKEMTID
jgi:hypothetical protein